MFGLNGAEYQVLDHHVKLEEEQLEDLWKARVYIDFDKTLRRHRADKYKGDLFPVHQGLEKVMPLTDIQLVRKL